MKLSVSREIPICWRALQLAEAEHGTDSVEAGIVLIELEELLEEKERQQESLSIRLRLVRILRRLQPEICSIPDVQRMT